MVLLAADPDIVLRERSVGPPRASGGRPARRGLGIGRMAARVRTSRRRAEIRQSRPIVICLPMLNRQSWPISVRSPMVRVGSGGEAGGKSECGLAVHRHVVAEDDVALAIDPVDENAGSQPAPIPPAVGLEQGLADEHPLDEVVDRAHAQECPEHGLDDEAGGGEREAQDPAPDRPDRAGRGVIRGRQEVVDRCHGFRVRSLRPLNPGPGGPFDFRASPSPGRPSAPPARVRAVRRSRRTRIVPPRWVFQSSGKRPGSASSWRISSTGSALPRPAYRRLGALKTSPGTVPTLR